MIKNQLKKKQKENNNKKNKQKKLKSLTLKYKVEEQWYKKNKYLDTEWQFYNNLQGHSSNIT